MVMLGLGAVLAGASDARGFTVAVEGVGDVTAGAFLTGAGPDEADSLDAALLVVAGFAVVDVARGLVGLFVMVEPLAPMVRDARLDADADAVLVLSDDLSVVGTRFPPTADDAPDGGSLLLELFVLAAVDPPAGVVDELDFTGPFVALVEVDGLPAAPLAPNVPEPGTCEIERKTRNQTPG